MSTVTLQNDQSTTCAIMQPTFLPWLGYFNLIHSVDTFIFLDDVQLDKRSWQTRNRLFTGHTVNWVSCPIQKASRNTRICDAYISHNTDWQSKLIKTITHSYAKAPFFDDCAELLSVIHDAPTDTLSNFNQHIIVFIASRMGLNVNFITASTLQCGGKKSHHLLALCKAVNANNYYSPRGSKNYIEEEGVLYSALDSVEYQDFVPKPYSQYHCSDFESHLSIVDAVANIGWNATKQHIIGHK